MEELEEAQQQLIEQVLDRLDRPRLAARMVEVFTEEIPGYAELPDAVIQGQVLETAAQVVELFKRIVRDPSLPTEEDLVGIRESALNRAAEGLPLADLLHAYRVGGQLGWEGIVDAAKTADDREALLGAAALMMAYIDRLSSAVAETYLAERQHMVSEDTRVVGELIQALASEEPVSSDLRSFAARLGMPIVESYRAFALNVPEAPAHVHSQIAASLRLEGVLALTEGDLVIGLAVPDVSPDLLHGGNGLLVLRESASRPELDSAMIEARTLLDLARRAGQAKGLVNEAGLAIPLLLTRSPRAAGLLRGQVLGPLESYRDQRGGDLIESLRVYFAQNLNRTKAAKELHIHPNTLDYRLGRVEELCQLKLADPRDIAKVALALAQDEPVEPL